jgi:amino acid adenylation domain-containing protein
MLNQREGVLTLTHPQKRIWYVEQLYPGTPLHNLAGTATYQCALDFGKLESAFNLFVRLHPATRIRLVEMPDGQPGQYISPFAPFSVSCADFTTETSPSAAFRGWLDRKCRLPFDLNQGSLFRVEFFRLSENECGYFVNCHHLISDGWSFQVLAAFIREAYRGQSPEETDVRSYLDFAQQEHRYLMSQQFEQSRQFWLEQLREAPRYPVGESDTVGEQVRFRLRRESAEQVRRFARDAGGSTTAFFTALLFAYLHQREGSDDLVIGMPILNRPGRSRKVFGMYASTMPLRMQLSDSETIFSFTRRVQSALQRCFRHQRYPYDLLGRDLGMNGNGRHSLFRACMNVYNTNPADAARIGVEPVTVEECYVGHQLFPLYVIVKEWSQDEAIEFHCDYKPAVYSRQEVEELAAFLVHAAEVAPNAPDTTLGKLVSSIPSTNSRAEKRERESVMTVTSAFSPQVPTVTRFPVTRVRSRQDWEPARHKELAFALPAPLRAMIAQAFGADQAALDSVFAAAVCVLLARCCFVSQVRIAVAGSDGERGRLRDLLCDIKPDAQFYDVLSAVRRTPGAGSYKTVAPAAAYGVFLHPGHTGQVWGEHIASVTIATPDPETLGKIVYDASLYDYAEIELILSRLLHILESVARSGSASIGELDVVGDTERALLLERFNDTDAPFPGDTTIIRQFEQTASKYPNFPALRAGTDVWSYERLNRRSNQFAHFLRENGVGRTSIVPVMVERSPELLVAILGVLKAGGAFLPIDPTYPQSRIEFILEDSQAPFVISNSGLFTSGAKCGLVAMDDDRSYSGATTNISPVSDPGDLAYVCYTSGSTGKPKGAMIEHRSLVNRLHWMQRAYPLSPDDVLIQKTSISFDVSVWELFWWTLAGASLCLTAPGDEKIPEKLAECIEQHRVTVIHFVPSMLQAFLRYAEQDGKVAQLRSLRKVFASGEALQTGQVDAFYHVFASGGTTLTNLYGPTEATIDVTYYDCPAGEPCLRVPIGKPIDNTRIRILSQTLRLQPVGAPGELYIGGVGVARGYWNRAELNEERFVTDPYAPCERLYRTGDLARWLPDGEIEFLGRNDEQVKLRGYRIELGEIEASLRQHASVQDAVVVLRTSPQGAQQLCGYVTLKEACTMDQLREHLAARLPGYMVPGWLQEIEAIPLSPNGKLDRTALPVPTLENGVEGAQTVEERALAEIWQDVLEIPRVGVDDNFFALGGDSIKSITVIVRARSDGYRITTQDVYRYPTIRRLAQTLSPNRVSHAEVGRKRFELLRDEDRAALPDTAVDAYPLSALQIGLIYQSQIIRATPFYHDVFSYRINGVFHAAKFEEAVGALCRDHAIFRTTFHLDGFSEQIQIVHREVPTPLTISDLRGMTSDAQELAIQRDIADIRSKTFDWQVPNLIGFNIHLLSESEYLYTIDFHDSALDGWSVNIIHRELFETYYGLLAGQGINGSKAAMRFSEFVALEREALHDQEHKEFWARTLEGSSFISLPRGSSPAEVAGSGVGFHEVCLPAGLSDAIKQTANQLCVPIKTVLLAAHIYVLSLLTGERDITTGYECGVRPEGSDGERATGLFLNTLPFRVRVNSESWIELVQRVYQAEIDLIPYRRYPMAQIKRDRGVRGPLFENVFNFTHFHVLSGLKRIPGFDLMEVKVRAETEFVFRAECSVHPFSDEVLLWIHYHTDVFAPERINDIGGYFTRTLQALTRDPAAAPKREFLLARDEQHRQLCDFNSSRKELPASRCAHQLFEEQAALAPNKTAATCGAERWTFAQLNQAANKIAHALLRRTAGSKLVVAVAARRNLAWMASVLACFKAGCVYLPLDVDHPAERMSDILARSDCRLVIAGDAALREKVSEATVMCRDASAIEILLADKLVREGGDVDNLSVVVSPDDLAYIIFTSGSTGTPKGAMIEHGGMLNHLLAKINDLALTPDDVVVQNASQCFDISVWQLLSASLVGGRVAIFGEDTVDEIGDFMSALRSKGVSILEVVPSYLNVMLQFVENSPVTLPSLRYLLVTGEPTKVALVERWFARFPEIPVVNAYGPTEAADDICHHFMTEAPASALVPVGRPIQNLNVYILDEGMEMLPLGAAGEVCVAGIGVGRGYINDPDRTASAFVNDPFQPSRRMYKTGDIGRWLPDGVLELAGRRDDQIKIRGYRIETGEIENSLQLCPGINQVAVMADSQHAKLIAFVVADGAIDAGELKRQLSRRLPEYMIPSNFVGIEALPLSANGKVDKQRLAEWLERLPDELTPIAPPVGATETDLQLLWADVLKVEPARIGRDSDFFDLGGHSLKAMELSLRANRRFSIGDVTRYSVLQDLARRIESLAASPEPIELLVDYSNGSAPAALSLIGFTYAGGNAVNFKPLFDALNQRSRQLACFAVELPRQPQADLESTARMCLEEIRKKVHTPIILWGHCSGSALALEVARLLEANAFDLRLVVLGGKVINSRPVVKARALAARALSPFMPVDAASMSSTQIKEWLINKTGFDGFSDLNEEDALFLIEAFRSDATMASRYLERAYSLNGSLRFRAPILNVVAEDDILTKGYRKKHRNWKLFSEQVEISVLDSGGHYFIKTRPKETADLILNLVHRLESAS